MEKDKKIILDLCGGTGAWSKPYSDAGYDVRLITWPEDVRFYKLPILEGWRKEREQIYGILSAPPCTHLANIGSQHWKQKGDKALLEALSIVDACLRIIYATNPVFWALENPIGRLVHYIGKPLMYFNPHEYGDPYTKKTCLWGKFNIPKKNIVRSEGKNPIWNMPPSKNRGELRSITPAGFAKAFYEANK